MSDKKISRAEMHIVMNTSASVMSAIYDLSEDLIQRAIDEITRQSRPYTEVPSVIKASEVTIKGLQILLRLRRDLNEFYEESEEASDDLTNYLVQKMTAINQN